MIPKTCKSQACRLPPMMEMEVSGLSLLSDPIPISESIHMLCLEKSLRFI